jgi:hypothetical protein
MSGEWTVFNEVVCLLNILNLKKKSNLNFGLATNTLHFQTGFPHPLETGYTVTETTPQYKTPKPCRYCLLGCAAPPEQKASGFEIIFRENTAAYRR